MLTINTIFDSEFSQFLDLNIYSFIVLSLFFLIVGSFISCLVYRIPLKLHENVNIFFPSSHCPVCKNSIKKIFLIPLIGFIVQKGICFKCKTKISYFYPLTEIYFLLLGLSLLLGFGLSYSSIVLFLISAIYYILFFTDLYHKYLPLPLTMLVIALGSLSNIFLELFINFLYLDIELSAHAFVISGFLVGYGFLWIINFIFKKINGFDGIGGGDFILLGGIGTIFGPISILPIVFFGSLIGCICFVIFKFKRNQELPFGSFLILSTKLYFLSIYFELI